MTVARNLFAIESEIQNGKKGFPDSCTELFYELPHCLLQERN
jgi:hypothetical protein